jgi:hypothetical protein
VLDRKSEGNSVSFSAFDELRDSPTLPQHEKTLDRLSDEGTLMIMAGMYSTRIPLSVFCDTDLL